MALDTNSEEYKAYWDKVDSEGGMGVGFIPQPGTGTVPDLWWLDPNDPSKGLSGKDPETIIADGQKFLWMPIKWGIPVAIVGIAALSYGVYRVIKHYKKAA